MKRTFVVILAVVAGAALFAGLVYAVLVVARVSEQPPQRCTARR